MTQLKDAFMVILSIFIMFSCNDLNSRAGRLDLIKDNKADLELVVVNLLNSSWTEKEVQEYLNKKRIPLTIDEVNKENGTVSFVIDGMLDNCSGIAYSRTGKKAYICGGNTVDWERLLENWYFINSI